MGDLLIETIAVDPQDENTWYVGGAAGLYITRDSGRSWIKSLSENASDVPVQFAPGDSCTVFAALNTLPNGPNRVRRSTNKGATWTTILETTEYFRSLHVGRNDRNFMLAGTQIDPRLTPQPDVFYQTVDGGVAWMRRSVDGRSRGLIPWSIAEDINGVIYTGTEIYDHPQPYRPPFWRSTDRGAAFQEVGALPWHVTAIQSHPSQSLTYALTEGAGLYSTSDAGASWRRLGSSSFTLDIKLDRLNPTRIYGGDIVFGNRQGGFYVSIDSGESFRLTGLQGQIIGSIALDSTSRVVYLTSYRGGLYRAVVPTNPAAGTAASVSISDSLTIWDNVLPGTSKLAERPREVRMRPR
jgi:hypothetical protein